MTLKILKNISMKPSVFSLLILLTTGIISCNGQTKKPVHTANSSSVTGDKNIGGGCEGCQLMYAGMPENINAVDTSAGWRDGRQKLILTGQVFHLDGRTPAPNVIIYYWHTNDKGLYTADHQTPAQAKEHGRLRGWVKTDENGKYSIKTSRPAAYPNDVIPQHIHLSIKEPQLPDEYFIDLYFDDDPLYLPHKKKYGKADRGGTEILRVVADGKTQIAEHNIILGLNIPNYPAKKVNTISSGLNIGEDQPSFLPFHAYGPDKGTRTCPVCKYGRYHGLMFFVGNNPNWKNIKAWLSYLEKESIAREQYLKAYFVYGNANNYNKAARQKELEAIGNELGIVKMALTFVPSFLDIESEANLNKINPEAESTFIIYKHRTIVDKFVNLEPTPENFKLITQSLEKTKGDYFGLPAPRHD
jgi:protocatechuate 3,4-dioxygenase, beta subunit